MNGKGREETNVEESAERALGGCFLQIGVREDDGAGFAAELHQHGLEGLAGGGGDDAADVGAAGEIDLLDGGVLDQQGGDGRGVLGAVREHVEAAGGQAGFLEDGADGPVAARGELGRFEDGGVARCEGVGDGAEAEDVRRVPAGKVSGGLVECFQRQWGVPTMVLCLGPHRMALCTRWRWCLLPHRPARCQQ